VVKEIAMAELSESCVALTATYESWTGTYGDTVTVYGEGLIYASVCTALDDEATDAAMATRPSGTSGGWTRSADTHFDGGLPNPCPCDTHPDTRRHVLYEA
jgi:hypothetical protein